VTNFDDGVEILRPKRARAACRHVGGSGVDFHEVELAFGSDDTGISGRPRCDNEHALIRRILPSWIGWLGNRRRADRCSGLQVRFAPWWRRPSFGHGLVPVDQITIDDRRSSAVTSAGSLWVLGQRDIGQLSAIPFRHRTTPANWAPMHCRWACGGLPSFTSSIPVVNGTFLPTFRLASFQRRSNQKCQPAPVIT
jgi:hypothetical protein